MSTPAESNRLEVTRRIQAPPARVFAAWTTPDQIKHWFGPANCTVLEAQIDLRVGGKYRFRVTNGGEEMAVSGEYREIAAPSKLVFTWRWEDDEDWAKITSVVTVEFSAKDGGAEVRVQHEGLPSAESAGRHEHGWNGCLDKLAMRSATIAEMNGPGQFSWNELITSDVESAKSFYSKLLGWEPVPMPGGMPYTLFKKNGSEVGGMMAMPGVPPHWLSYVTVENADATAARAAELGGTICKAPFDIPEVGRIAIVVDPQGAAIGLFQPSCR